MLKTKKEMLFNIYKTYKCENGHVLKWEGSHHLFGPLSCGKCGKKNNINSSVIRWSCLVCNHHYCTQCFGFLAGDYCPSKDHKLQYISDVNGQFSTYHCDICFVSYKVSDGMWYDNVCNVTFCDTCKNEADDIPEEFEE